MTTTRTASQSRSAALSSKDKRRVWTAWDGLPCAWCGLPVYTGTDKGGSLRADRTNAADAAIGHVVPWSVCGTYNSPNVAVTCNTCNAATGERDCSEEVAPSPAWRAVSQKVADVYYPNRTTVARADLPGHDERTAARIARLGW